MSPADEQGTCGGSEVCCIALDQCEVLRSLAESLGYTTECSDSCGGSALYSFAVGCPAGGKCCVVPAGGEDDWGSGSGGGSGGDDWEDDTDVDTSWDDWK